MIKNINYCSKYILLLISIIFIYIGILRNEHLVVLKKAVKICLECIGVG
ncbi:CD1871A family CXXC motif-containing protein [Paeniclostridium hominis]|nr:MULTISPECIES: CD1871A family CXXC motif-containing protein [Paeniclostridium]